MNEGQNSKLIFDYSGANIGDDLFFSVLDEVSRYHSEVYSREGDMLGWVDSPALWLDKIGEIEYLAGKIREQSEAVVVLGIGGSYLGAKAVIEAINPDLIDAPEIYFAGNNFSSSQINRIVKKLEDKSFSLIVISKSGDTLETALAFRIFRKIIWDRYGESSSQRIYTITDQNNGSLRRLTNHLNYESLPVPEDIGGRYSVLSSVGLLPIAIAGIDIKDLLHGAVMARNNLSNIDLSTNIAVKYAILRNYFYKQGKTVELFTNFQPELILFSEWLKQLFGESDGKDGKGLFPSSANYTTDLHSLGQFVQEGTKTLFETVFYCENAGNDINIHDYDVSDGLEYLNGTTVSGVNHKAMLGTIEAHKSAGVPVLMFSMADFSPAVIGEFIFTMELACVLDAKMLEVNPFNQPGVEQYKNNMFRLLGRPES